MSTIVGVFHRDGRSASRNTVDAMAAALGHRGYHPGRFWSDGPVAMGPRCSSITGDPSGESRQSNGRASGLVLIADARIDNRLELCAALSIAAGARPSDDEIILQSYERWGRDCARRLIGDFAFAIWDPRSQSIFCARDAMGIRPLYFHLSDRLFVVASEIKGLFQCPDVPRRIDDEQVALHLAAFHDDRTATMYSGISRLAAAETMVVTREGSSRAAYWKPEIGSHTRFSTDEQYVEAFREVFGTAVRDRLRGRAPIGATLSGGLDSSSIVCVARRSLASSGGPPLHTFSLVFPELSESDRRLIDEREYIRSVVREGGVIPHQVRGDLIGPLDDVRRMLWHLDEPFFAPNLYLHWAMYSAARDAGVGVLLDGFDGDSAVSHGFGRLNGLMQSGDWSVFEAEVRAFAVNSGRRAEQVLDHFGLPYLSHLARRGAVREWHRASGELTRRFGLSRGATAWRHGVLPVAPDALRSAWRSIRGVPADDDGVLRAPWAERVEQRRRRHAQTSNGNAAWQEQDMHAAGLSQPLFQLTLEMADKCARAFGIEPRYPFFDRRVIDFCVSLPDEQKFSGGWSRMLLRRAMEGTLPPDVQWRTTKGNLAPNFNRRLVTGDLSPAKRAAAAPEINRYVDATAVRAAEHRYHSVGKSQDWRNPDGPLLFRISVMSTWLSGLHKDAGPVSSSSERESPRPSESARPVVGDAVGDSRRDPVECRT